MEISDHEECGPRAEAKNAPRRTIDETRETGSIEGAVQTQDVPPRDLPSNDIKFSGESENEAEKEESMENPTTIAVDLSKSVFRGNRRVIAGARSVLLSAHRARKPHRQQDWALAVERRRGRNRAAIALANKLERIVWAAATRGDDFRKSAASSEPVTV